MLCAKCQERLCYNAQIYFYEIFNNYSCFLLWHRGEFKGSFRHGRGSLSVPLDSLEFQGTWFRGKKNGIGKAVFPDGEFANCSILHQFLSKFCYLFLKNCDAKVIERD